MSRRRLLAVLLPLLAAACAGVEPELAETQGAAEVRAQMQVKAALLESAEVAAAPIRVEFEDGVLTLRGYVETEAERRRAEEIARSARPRVEIANRLEVWGAAGEESVAAPAPPRRDDEAGAGPDAS